jgi:hypothetical protein
MNEARRERIRELIRTLESAEEQLQAILIDEENASEGRTAASKETELGTGSEDAMDHLEWATTELRGVIEEMQSAVGNDSLPEPVAPPSERPV